MPDPVAAGLDLAGASRLRDLLNPKLQRAFLLNLDNNRRLDFLLNPTSLKESYGADYKRHAPLGLSHQRLQFVGNPNTIISFELVFDQVIYRERASRAFPETGGADVQAQNEVDEVRRQILELVYPRRATKLVSASPPPILFHWPGMINMRVRLTKVEFNHEMFASGTPLPRILKANVTLEEEAMERIFSEDMLTQGTWRPWGASDRPRRRGT